MTGTRVIRLCFFLGRVGVTTDAKLFGFQIAFTELRLIRTFERIDVLKDAGRWSFRQPKKQRGVGGLMKSHWDHLIDEMVCRAVRITL